jgi:tape measure domain-containing protein
MADAAQLKLQVGLDLAFFRQQLAQLGTVAVGYQMPINIKFDRLGIQQELNRLEKNINRRKYRLEVATNIKSETEAAQKLDAALDALKDKTINVKFAGTGDLDPKEARKIRTALSKSILSNGGKIKIPATILAAITQDDVTAFTRAAQAKLKEIALNVRADITSSADGLDTKEVRRIRVALRNAILSNGGKIKIPATIEPKIGNEEVAALQKAVDSKFAGITVKVKAEVEEIRGGKAQAQIEKEAMAGWQRIQEMGAARMGGGVSDPARRESLRQSLSGRGIGELRDIGEQLGVKGVRRYSNVQNLIEKIVADASIEMVKQYLDPQAVMRNPDRSGLGKVLDTFARGIFQMLGMDPAAMMAAERIKRLPPSINWPASIAAPAQYQSQRGTMLAGAPALKGIGGTAFGAQKYLPTALGNETKKVLRDAAYVFLDTIKQGIREVRVQDLGKSLGDQKLLRGKGIAGLLPPMMPGRYDTGSVSLETRASSWGQGEIFAKREREARVRSAFREMDVLGSASRQPSPYSQAYRSARPTSAIVPYAAGGALVAGGGGGQPPTPPSGGREGSSGFGGFSNAMAGIKLPGAGLISELGGEFAQAAKQVLLFGTAYKALAFLTGFPAQVSEAVAQLQTFNNTLKAITPSSDEFRIANQFILDTVDKYNVPLQSAREGFTNLYASMEPAGFKGNEIRDIFTGVSQAAATFGMSADRVDRVNYAFAQMASKGQVMSEELKGQLGDVLPGAVAIFAKAAGFTGPNAMVDFTKAMEDGRYKGEAMKQLLINVGIVMKDKFAKGAEGAAQSFQGQMNAMATATQKLYESFTPVANLFASNVVKPLTEGIKVAAEGFNAFFSGAATKTAGGFALSQELEKMRPMFKGITDNIKQLLPLLQSFATTTLGLAKILLQIASNPFVGYLARAYLAVLPLTMAIQVLNLQALIPMIGSLLRAIPAFIAFSTAAWNGASRTVALRIAMQATGQTATIAGGQVALLSNTLKTAFVGTVVGAVVIGIGMIIERIMTLSGKMEEAKGSALRLQDSIKGMSKTELQVEENKLGMQEVMLRSLQMQGKGQKYVTLNKQQEEALMTLAPGSITRVSKAGKGGNKLVEVASGLKAIGGGLAAIDVTMLPAIEQKIQSLRQNIDSARLTLNASDQNTSLNLAPIPGAGGDPKAAKTAAAALTSQQALADKLSSDQTKTDIERQKTLFENEKSMINMTYDLREARANSFQKETIRFQKELFNIEMERQKAVLDANSAVTKAQGAVAGGPASTSGFIDKSVLQKWLESQGFGRTTGDFTSKGHATPNHMLNAMDMGIIGGSDADALRKTKAMEERLRRTGAFGNQLFGPTNDPMGHGAGRGGQNIHLHIPTPGGKVPMTPGLAAEMNYSGAPSSTSSGGKVTARQKRVALADQQTENALQDTKVKTTLAEAEALKKAEIAMVNYISSIAPVAEQDLQNQLLGKRIELMQSGVPEAFAETQMKIFEAQEKVRMAGEELDLTNQKQVEAYEKLKQSLPGYIALLENAAVKQQQLGFTKTMKDLGDRAAMARALTPEAEMRTRLQQQSYAGAQLETLFETEKATVKAEELKTKMQGVASTISDAFSTAFQGIINGSMSAQDALAGMFQSIGQSFIKMAMEMIAQQVTMITLGFIMKALGLLGSAAGAGSTPLPGSAPQMTPNAIVTPTGFQGMIPANFAAKGATFSNGIAKFATGGIVNGPTLFPFADGGAMQMGLMGEAGPEAIMPLQRGSDGSLGVRAAMGGNGMGGSSSPVLNMSFETSTINGVEYVSRDQLEAAMAQTRRQASRDGANKGMAMTLDKIQQSPQTRRRIGM